MYPLPYQNSFEIAASKASIPLELLYAQALRESHFDANTISRVGAIGLVQLMPETAKSEGWDEKSNLFDPEINLALGAKYMARIRTSFPDSKILSIAAYNAGPLAAQKWKDAFGNNEEPVLVESISFTETREYVKAVLAAEQVYKERLYSNPDR